MVREFKTLDEKEVLIKRMCHLRSQTREDMPDQERLKREIEDLQRKIDRFDNIKRWKKREDVKMKKQVFVVFQDGTAELVDELKAASVWEIYKIIKVREKEYIRHAKDLRRERHFSEWRSLPEEKRRGFLPPTYRVWGINLDGKKHCQEAEHIQA